MFRSLFLLVFVANFYCVNSSHAVTSPVNKISSTDKNIDYIFSCSEDKRKIEEEDKGSLPNKRRKIAPLEKNSTDQNDSFIQDSPRTRERKALSPFRRKFIFHLYKDDTKKKNYMSSPLARNVLEHHALLQYFERCVCVNKKTVYQGDFLFNPSAMVFTDGEWITNLDRMKAGKAPIGHRGIVSKEERFTLTRQHIERIQAKYRIELHHLTQKDTGSVQDPICEMTHVAHMGNNARFILEFDDKTEEIYIVHSNFEKEEALKLCAPHQFIVSNVLHFRKGKSLIDRKQFEEWRTDYWKMRATNIENPKRLHSLNNKKACRRLVF